MTRRKQWTPEQKLGIVLQDLWKMEVPAIDAGVRRHPFCFVEEKK